MKSTVFNLSNPIYEGSDPAFDMYNEVFIVPTLPAYAILSHTLDCSRSYTDELVARLDYKIEGNKVYIKHVKYGFPNGQTTATLNINYSGIRDYRQLFPQVENDILRERLGQFAEEADKAFEVGAWMSFTVMVVSVIEGVLVDIYKKDNLNNLINAANRDLILTKEEADLFHNARKVRNAVHAGRFNDAFADRAIGNDLYVTYDHLIKKNWAVKNQEDGANGSH